VPCPVSWVLSGITRSSSTARWCGRPIDDIPRRPSHGQRRTTRPSWPSSRS
jgi:hypothetical protein